MTPSSRSRSSLDPSSSSSVRKSRLSHLQTEVFRWLDHAGPGTSACQALVYHQTEPSTIQAPGGATCNTWHLSGIECGCKAASDSETDSALRSVSDRRSLEKPSQLGRGPSRTRNSRHTVWDRLTVSGVRTVDSVLRSRYDDMYHVGFCLNCLSVSLLILLLLTLSLTHHRGAPATYSAGCP